MIVEAKKRISSEGSVHSSPPELITNVSQPIALATLASFRIEAIKASDEKGRTIPDVPIMEIPPIIPSFGLKVRFCQLPRHRATGDRDNSDGIG